MVFKHHIGLQVATNEWDGEKDLRGMTGILRTLTEDGVYGLVEYAKNIQGSDGLDQGGHKVGKKGHCYWQKVDFLSVHGRGARTAKDIQGDYEHRGRNLKGMPFKLLGTMARGDYAVVEFKEDIGGHSADGHGKKEQCLCVPIEVTQKPPTTKAKRPYEMQKEKKAGKK